jgi:hypothetical protein
LVAYPSGGRGVASSNLVTPTKFKIRRCKSSIYSGFF